MDKVCFICELSDDNELKYGQFLTNPDKKDKISAHFFCLILSSNLIQRGDDSTGLLGFLPKDIRKEKIRVLHQHCAVCSKGSANIACCKKTCRQFYHLKCGYEAEVLYQFKDNFSSYCKNHHTVKETDRPKKKDICYICTENIGKFNSVNIIKAPCCRNGWFHKWCLSEYAQNAGYFFKCPLCQNEDIFRSELPNRGIFIPDKDASWETEPNAYQELLERPHECAAEKCICSKGRTHHSESYKFIFCGTCGSSAIHEKCHKKQTAYNCADCNEFISLNNTTESEVFTNEDRSRRGSSSSSESTESIIRPRRSNTNLRMRLTSDSEDSESSENIYPAHRLRKRYSRISSSSESSQGLDVNESDYSSEDIYPRRLRNSNTRILSDSEGSELYENISTRKRRSKCYNATDFESGYSLRTKRKLHDIYESESESQPVKSRRTTMSSTSSEDSGYFRSRANRFAMK